MSKNAIYPSKLDESKHNFQRVMIIGSGGAGKSTLSKKVATILNLPLIHLDKIFWKPNWEEPDKNIWAEKVSTLAAKEHWILDGNYSGTFEIRLRRADLVIWLDYPNWVCVWRVLKRLFSHNGKTRTDMAAGCQERFDWNFLAYVLHFPSQGRRRLIRKLAASENNHFVLQIRKDRELKVLLEDLVRPARFTP